MNRKVEKLRQRFQDYFQDNCDDAELILVVLYDDSVDADIMTTLTKLSTARILQDAAKKMLENLDTYEPKDLN